MYSSQMSSITYNNHDILSGRGHKINTHPGNIYFRALVKKLKPIYQATDREDKHIFGKLVVGQIQGLNPPGRFLKKSEITGLWEDIGLESAVAKTKQAIREKDSNCVARECDELEISKREICQLMSECAREVYKEVNHGDISMQTFHVQTPELGFMDINDFPTLFERLHRPKTLRTVDSDKYEYEYPNNGVLNIGCRAHDNGREYKGTSKKSHLGSRMSIERGNNTYSHDDKLGTMVTVNGREPLQFYDLKTNRRVSVANSLISLESSISNSTLTRDSIHTRGSFNQFPSLLSKSPDEFDEMNSTKNASVVVNDRVTVLNISTLSQDSKSNSSNSRSSLLVSNGNRSSLDSFEHMADQITKMHEDNGFVCPSSLSDLRMSLDEQYREELDELMESVRSNECTDTNMLRNFGRSVSSMDSCRTGIYIRSRPQLDEFQSFFS